MKKILIIVTKGEIGGAQIFVLNLARMLKKVFKADVWVGFGDGDFLENELKKEDIPVVRFKNLKRTHNPFSNIAFMFEIKNFLHKNDFEAVHFNSSNTLFGVLGSKMDKIQRKTIFTFHGMSMLDENYTKNKLLSFAYKLFFKFFIFFIDETVFVSKRNLDTAKKIKLIQPKTELEKEKRENVIYNGLDAKTLDFYSKEKSLAELAKITNQNFENKFILGSVARLAYPKNFEFIINIFPEILKIKENAVFVIIGKGPEKEKYQRLIKKLGLEKNIILVGELENAYKYTKGFDLFVLPSIYEGMSITLIEALFAELPILTTKVGGSPEILNNSEEQLYQLDNKQEFLEKFEKLIQNKKIKDYNKSLQNKFDLKYLTSLYWKIYNR